MSAQQPESQDESTVMTDALAKKLLRNCKPKHLFNFQVPLARDENLSKDWTPAAGDFSLWFNGKGVIYQQDFDGQRWQPGVATSLTKASVEEMVSTGAWELVEYMQSTEMPMWYFRISGEDTRIEQTE